MRTDFTLRSALWLVLLVAGCSHDLDALFKDTVVDAGKGSSGSGGRTSSGSGGAGADEDDGGPSSAGGAGGASGSGGSGVVETMDPCSCEKLSSELDDKGIETCCRGIAKSECGLSFGDKAACLPRMVPGKNVSQCPGAGVGQLKLTGCCRPDSRCGYKTEGAGALLNVFGCIAREEVPTDFATGIETSPIACNYECEGDDDCSALPGDFVCTPNPQNGSQRICARVCNRDADCSDKRVCAIGQDKDQNRVNEFCQMPLGPVAPGGACTDPRDCMTGACILEVQKCSQFCLNPRDCLANQDCVASPINRPNADAGTQDFKICVDSK